MLQDQLGVKLFICLFKAFLSLLYLEEVQIGTAHIVAVSYTHLSKA